MIYPFWWRYLDTARPIPDAPPLYTHTRNGTTEQSVNGQVKEMISDACMYVRTSDQCSLSGVLHQFFKILFYSNIEI